MTFENVQARERTQILFDTANLMGGLVVGTGDLSELALGWCTFNADQMASYNVNAGVPKTLIAYLVRWYVRHRGGRRPAIRAGARIGHAHYTGADSAGGRRDHPSKPKPSSDPTSCTDFTLYHFLRNGAGAVKIFVLACRAFDGVHTPQRNQALAQGLFFGDSSPSNFKRTTLPPGPKVGTVSLSPRGDWRMPDEASAGALLAAIDEIETN